MSGGTEVGLLLRVTDTAGVLRPVIVTDLGRMWHWIVDEDSLELLELVLDDAGLPIDSNFVEVTFEGGVGEIIPVTCAPLRGAAHLVEGLTLDGQKAGTFASEHLRVRFHNGELQCRRSDGAENAPWVKLAGIKEFFARYLASATEVTELVKELFKERRIDLLVLYGDDPQVLLVPASAEGFVVSAADVISPVYEAAHARIEQIAAEKQQETAAIGREFRLKEYREQFTSPEVFVNPYNFVPMTENVVRREPANRAVLGPEKRMGHIDVEWEAETPLLFGSGVGDTERVGLERDMDGTFRVAGSSLKGAVSSLHEALCGSCLRITELDFVPAYRETAQVRRRRLALIVSSDEDGPTEALVLETVWCDVTALHTGRAAPDLRTGDVLRLRDATHWKDHDREILNVSSVEWIETVDVAAPGGARLPDLDAIDDDDWIVLVGSLGLRRGPTRFSVALGRLRSGRRVTVADGARSTWKAAIPGSEFAAALRDGDRRSLTKVETSSKVLVGRRVTMGAQPEVGDLLWAETDTQSANVTYLAASNIWRRAGSGALGERIPAGAAPCGTMPDGSAGDLAVVCPSCELFGAIAASNSADSSASAEHHALRGLVRFSHLTITSPDGTLERRSLPPRGTPKMGAGQFYLSITNRASGEPPTAQWGSTHDSGALRRVRGRKFYWHADAPEVPMEGGRWSRAVARPRQVERSGMGAQEVELVPPGSKIRARLHFENLDDLQLGSLIAALNPDLALLPFRPDTWLDTSGTGQRRQLRTHLGGGKPLGLGSVRVISLTVRVEHHRYAPGAMSIELSLDEAAGLAVGFVDSLAESGSDHLYALAAMLDPDRVAPDRVAYPPGGSWGSELSAFDEPFAFFARTRGDAIGGNRGSILPLPRPQDDPWMNIAGRDEVDDGR